VRDPSTTYYMNELLEMARRCKRRDIELAIRYAFARQWLFGAPDVLHRLGRSVGKRLGLYKRPKHEFPWKAVPDDAKAEIRQT